MAYFWTDLVTSDLMFSLFFVLKASVSKSHRFKFVTCIMALLFLILMFSYSVPDIMAYGQS